MILRDPVHGLIAFERPEEGLVAELLDTPEVQRLRRVRMLGVTSLAFPGAEHSRFAHAVGAAHVMRCFLARMRSLAQELPAGASLTLDEERLALAAALLHDVGHGPLSHLFEEVFENAPPHESWTSALLLDPSTEVHRALARVDRALPVAVERLVHGEHPKQFLAHAVSGTFDVDRCDYLLRDSCMTGVRYGLFDLEWLLRSLRLTPTPTGTARLAIDGTKGLPAVEGFFLARLFMYEQVYFHKAGRAAEFMIRALFARAVVLVRDGGDGEGLPPPLLALARGATLSAGEYATLDDGSVWTTVERWEKARDGVLRDLAVRLRRRALFKTALLDDEDAERAPALYEALREIVAAAGFDPRYYAALDVADIAPYASDDPADESLQVVYDRRESRPLSRASFLIGRLQGETLVRRRLVFPVEVREKVEALLGHAPPQGASPSPGTREDRVRP